MDAQLQIFIILLVIGLLLVGAEVFIPGGVLGFIGGIALLGAVITGFARFGAMKGGYIAGAVVILVGVMIALWIIYFPRTWVGRRMTVSKDLRTSKGTEAGIEELIGTTGITISGLHPSGFALIGGKRVDVISQGEMISKDAQIRVVDVEGNRVIVEEVTVEQEA